MVSLGENRKLHTGNTSWTLPLIHLPWVDVNLYHFAVKNHNYEYNSFQ